MSLFYRFPFILFIIFFNSSLIPDKSISSHRDDVNFLEILPIFLEIWYKNRPLSSRLEISSLTNDFREIFDFYVSVRRIVQLIGLI